MNDRDVSGWLFTARWLQDAPLLASSDSDPAALSVDFRRAVAFEPMNDVRDTAIQ